MLKEKKRQETTMVRVSVGQREVVKALRKNKESFGETFRRVLRFYLKKHPKKAKRIVEILKEKKLV